MMEQKRSLLVEILLASCCNKDQIEKDIGPMLQNIKGEGVPELDWRFLDIEKDPNAMVKYAVPMTPAIVINGKIEFIGLPKRAKLESKIRDYSKNNGL
jgi:hypothetical protein